MKVRRVPWKNKDEWLSVYQAAYSGHAQTIKRALDQMDAWMEKSCCPPGVVSTHGLLSGVVGDVNFFPDTPFELQRDQLVLIYSSTIMRILNLMGDTDEKNKQTTLYHKAKALGFPDWLVNMRHQTAHGKTLPSLEYLRMGVTLLLKWFKTNYWEVNDLAMKDLVMERPRSVIFESKLSRLVDIYCKIQEVKSRVSCLKEIEDSSLVEGIASINSLTYHAFLKEASPWKTFKIDDLPPDEFQSMAPDGAIQRILLLIQQYLKNDKSFKIIAHLLSEDVKSHETTRMDIWGVLIRKLALWGHLIILMKQLRTLGFNEESAEGAARWFLALCRSLVQRIFVEKLKRNVLEKFDGKMKENFAGLTTTEFNSLRKAHESKNQRTFRALLFKKIQKKYPDFGASVLLLNPVKIPRKNLRNWLKKVCLHRNDYTEATVRALVILLDAPKMGVLLKSLMDIYSGKKTLAPSRSSHIKTLENFKAGDALVDLEDSDGISGSESSDELVLDSPWRPVGIYDWVATPFGKIPWTKTNGPFDLYPYTGSEERKVKVSSKPQVNLDSTFERQMDWEEHSFENCQESQLPIY